MPGYTCDPITQIWTDTFSDSTIMSSDINYILQEESYTSKCSSLDLESVKKHEEYVGKRIKRGLFRTKNNVKINADINGACNIIRKYKSKSGGDLSPTDVSGVVNHPVRINPTKMNLNIR